MSSWPAVARRKRESLRRIRESLRTGSEAVVTTTHNERASSSESTCAFFAALLARVQSPTCAASRASATKLRTLEARSDCEALSALPCKAAIFLAAMLKLKLVCCCAAAVSSAVSCGAICGGSGRDGVLGAEATVGIRGRCGRLGVAASGDGGGGTASSNSAIVLSGGTPDVAANFGNTGRTDRTEVHGKVLALAFCWAAHPVKVHAMAHRPRTQKRSEAQHEPARDSVDLCVMNDQAARGSSIRNVVPRPTSDVKSIEPL